MMIMSSFEILINEYSLVAEIHVLVGFLLILSGITFLTLSPQVDSHYLFPYWFASLLVLASGVSFIVRTRDSKVTLFVCGECHRTFLTELDLRKHYAIEHVKKKD
jgi:hypothetical protein